MLTVLTIMQCMHVKHVFYTDMQTVLSMEEELTAKHVFRTSRLEALEYISSTDLCFACGIRPHLVGGAMMRRECKHVESASITLDVFASRESACTLDVDLA
jgi:hypothetical protein